MWNKIISNFQRLIAAHIFQHVHCRWNNFISVHFLTWLYETKNFHNFLELCRQWNSFELVSGVYFTCNYGLTVTVKCGVRTRAVVFVWVVTMSAVLTIITAVTDARLWNASSTVALHPVRETSTLPLQPVRAVSSQTSLRHITAIAEELHLSSLAQDQSRDQNFIRCCLASTNQWS